jgi:hypothetical protein
MPPEVIESPSALVVDREESVVRPVERRLRIELLAAGSETHLVKSCSCGCGSACACLPCEIAPSEPDTIG